MENLLGRSYGRWAVLAFMGRGKGGNLTWLCRCECGELRDLPQSNLTKGLSKSCGCYRRDRMASLGKIHGGSLGRPPKRGAISYQAAHQRVKAKRGRAATHLCVDCQGPASDWSLRHDAAVTAMGTGKHRTSRYSLDIYDYEPRCRKCHKAYDKLARSGDLPSEEPQG